MTTTITHAEVLDEATAAAKAAVAAYVQKLKEQQPDLEHVDWHGCCGFAWVNMKPATSSFARWLATKRKENPGDRTYGRVDDYYGGVTWWDPGQWGGQSINIKEEGAMAFASVLRKHGFDARVMTRLD